MNDTDIAQVQEGEDQNGSNPQMNKDAIQRVEDGDSAVCVITACLSTKMKTGGFC